MTKVIIEWQNQFGGWYRFQEQHHEPNAYRTAEQRANRLNKKTHEAKRRNHNQILETWGLTPLKRPRTNVRICFGC